MAEWSENDTDLEQGAETEESQKTETKESQKTETKESQENIDIFEENEIDDNRFKAQETDFYGNQQIYNSRLDGYEKDMNCEYLSEEEREYAKQQYNEVYIEKRDAIDKWKEEHGQYEEERTELRIGGKKKSEEIEEQISYEIAEEQATEMDAQEIAEQNETNFENLSYEELVEKYKGNCAHDVALGDQYALYDKQIAEISCNKAYYSSEKEWNSYIDEKMSAQNDVSARRNQIQSEMRKLEKEMDRRKI